MIFRAALLLCLITMGQVAFAQDLEPRRWGQLPTGLNVFAVAAGYGESDIFFDPVLEIEDATSEVTSGGFVYLRTFGLFGRSSRVDVLVPMASGKWSGLLQGEPTYVRREGLADPRIRFSMLLYGGEARTPAEFAATPPSNTVVGAGISLRIPWGEYYADRLINLGQNRWVLRPQLGVTHTRKKWTYELTGSVFIYGDNDDFRTGNKLKNDPLWALQGHVIYTFRPGLWTAVSAGYGDGADAAVNGTDRGVTNVNWLYSVALGLPINRQQGLKIAWIGVRTQEATGADSDSINLAWQIAF